MANAASHRWEVTETDQDLTVAQFLNRALLRILNENFKFTYYLQFTYSSSQL